MSLGGERVRVCPADRVEKGARTPDFASPACRSQVLWTLDPQGRELWAELRFEPDGKPDGAALSVTLWNGESADGETLPLGRGDYHGRWIDWAPGG